MSKNKPNVPDREYFKSWINLIDFSPQLFT
jgi:hypothetical protein